MSTPALASETPLDLAEWRSESPERMTAIHLGIASATRRASTLPFDPTDAHCRPAADVFDLAAEGTEGAAAAVRVARRVCAGCPFIWSCAEYAIVNREAWGVWGSTTPAERERYLKIRNARVR